MLKDLSSSRCAVVLGDGDGRFLARFLKHNPEVQVLAVDSSAAMLQLLRQRCARASRGSLSRLRTLQASALEVVPARETNLVISHFFLDCLSEAELVELATRYARELLPGTRWLISDFDLPRSPWLRPLVRVYLRLLYAGFRLLTGLLVTRLPPIASTLRAAGFSRVRRCEFAAGILYTELWQLGPDSSQSRPAGAGQPSLHP